MKKVVLASLVLCSLWCHGRDYELFPLPNLELNMSASDLLRLFPTAKKAFEMNNERGFMQSGLVLCNITEGPFWDSALVKVEEGVVKSISYVQAHTFIQAASNVQPIYEKLVNVLGDTFEKKVVWHLVKKGKCRSPAFIWQNKDNIVVFTHSPFSHFSEGEPFICQLVVTCKNVPLCELLEYSDNWEDNDNALFLDVTGRYDGTTADAVEKNFEKIEEQGLRGE